MLWLIAAMVAIASFSVTGFVGSSYALTATPLDAVGVNNLLLGFLVTGLATLVFALLYFSHVYRQIKHEEELNVARLNRRAKVRKARQLHEAEMRELRNSYRRLLVSECTRFEAEPLLLAFRLLDSRDKDDILWAVEYILAHKDKLLTSMLMGHPDKRIREYAAIRTDRKQQTNVKMVAKGLPPVQIRLDLQSA